MSRCLTTSSSSGWRSPHPTASSPRRAASSTSTDPVATNVYMEALSPTMEEGRVVKWHKRDGDPVKTGDTLAEVETDKAVMDLVARADGVLRQVAAAEGQTVAVGSVVAVIASPGETVGAPVAAAPPPAPVPSGSGMRDAGGRMREAGGGVRGAAGGTVGPPGATRVEGFPPAKRLAREAGGRPPPRP